MYIAWITSSEGSKYCNDLARRVRGQMAEKKLYMLPNTRKDSGLACTSCYSVPFQGHFADLVRRWVLAYAAQILL
jgi:hypothetical protein